MTPRTGDEAAQRKELDRRVLAKEIDAWVWISAAGLAKEEPVAEYHGRERLELRHPGALSRTRSPRWCARAGCRMPATIPRDHRAVQDVDLETTRVTARAAAPRAGLAGFLFAYILFFMLYISMIIYGQQVMNGVLEEKSSRIVEVIISTVTPFELHDGQAARHLRWWR